MSDLDLESNVGDRDNYDLNKFEDYPEQNPTQFENLIGADTPSKGSKGTGGKSSSDRATGFDDDEDEDDRQCYDEDEQEGDIRSYMNKYKG